LCLRHQEMMQWMTQLSLLFVCFVLSAVRTCGCINRADGCVVHHINFWWRKHRLSAKHSVLTEIPRGWLPKNSLFQVTAQYWYGIQLVRYVVQEKCCDIEVWYEAFVHSSRDMVFSGCVLNVLIIFRFYEQQIRAKLFDRVFQA
jgi:hypothetical protein